LSDYSSEIFKYWKLINSKGDFMDFGKPKGKKTYSDNGIYTIGLNAKKYSKKNAIIFEDEKLTWEELWERSNRLANGYISLGLRKGDTVQIFLPNCLEYPEVVLGGNIAGLINTAGNYRLIKNELIYQLNDCKAKAIILKTEEQLKNVLEVKDKTPNLKYIIVIDNVNIKRDDIFQYYELLEKSSPYPPNLEVLPEDIHLLMYTSGTTGYPKGAARSNRNDYFMANSVCHEIGLTENDTYMAIAPMYSAASMGYMFATLLSGGTIAIVPKYDPKEVFRYIEKYKPTWFFMVPIMFDWVFSLPDEYLGKFDISSVRHVAVCGAPLHNATAKKIVNHFKSADVSNWLGASEFGFIARYSYKNGFKDEGCVGKPVFDLDLKLFDENGNEVKKGESGILYGRGFSMWEGYINNPKATQEAFLDQEWGTVGDIARQDDEGNFYVIDRKVDMIITGGINVYPIEIENVIQSHPDVVDVAVIGVPDEKWGEAVKAIVVKKHGSNLTENDLIKYCKERLAGFKVPKSVDFTDQIPRSFVGKALKKELRKKYWEGKEYKI
jgi:long-chain acyl-CoA synthetase